MKSSQLFITIILTILIFPNLNGQVTYSDFDDFKEAIENANPGDEIILKDGTYTSRSITIKERQGTPEAPIIIRAETIGGVTLNSGSYFDFRKCAHITFQGFKINITEKSTTFKLQASNHIRLTQNVLDGSGESYYKGDGTERNSAVWISVQGQWDDEVTISHHNRIDHNVFQNKQTLGNMIKIDGTNETQVSQYDIIEYNYFKNMGPRAENEMEAIRIGWSAMSESDGFCTVSNNLFEECNGDPEIISVKCNKNIIGHNTFRRCQGTVSLRHGNESVIEGNFFLGEGAAGTGGVRIYGSDHKIINNHFEGLTGTKWDAPITLTLGDAEEGNSGLTKHFRIERATIAYNTLVNNTYGVEVGYENQGKYSKPPRDVVMAYNLLTGSTNALVKYITAPDNMQWIQNLMFPSGTAVIGDGVNFSENEAVQADPELLLNTDLKYYKATGETPELTPSSDIGTTIENDIDGQIRTTPTQYGADEYSSGAVVYKPLYAKDVGPSTGEYLYATPSAFDFSVHQDTGAIQIQSNLNWEISKDADWIVLEKTSGSGDDIVQVIAQENETGIVRTATVTVTSTNSEETEEVTQKITINQLDKEPPMLEVSPQQIDAPAEGMEQDVEITSNINWTISTEADWVTISQESASNSQVITLTIDANSSISKRGAEVLISDGATQSQTITIAQTGSIGTEEKLDIVSAVASTEQSGNEASNTIDGSTDNRWSGEGDGAYITLDLGNVQNVSFIKVGLYKGDSRTSTFDILTSEDRTNYSESIMGITTEVTEDVFSIYDVDDLEARYVRIVGHGNSSSAWNSYTEFEVWGWNTATPTLDISDLNTVLISPNPSNGWIQIQGITSGNISIYSLDGKEVFHSSLLNGEVQHTGLNSGVYIIYVHFENQFVRKKLIIK